MKIDFHDAERWFGEAIWYWAGKLRNRLHSPEDLYHEILIKVVEHDWDQAYTYSINLKKVIPVDPSHVLRFIKSRMIDAVRRENRSKRGEMPVQVEDRSQPDVEPEIMLRDMFPGLGETDLLILIEIATPSARTLKIAFEEQVDAQREVRETGNLRMNVNGAPKITQAHVAKSLNLSTSRVALAVRRATGRLEV